MNGKVYDGEERGFLVTRALEETKGNAKSERECAIEGTETRVGHEGR